MSMTIKAHAGILGEVLVNHERSRYLGDITLTGWLAMVLAGLERRYGACWGPSDEDLETSNISSLVSKFIPLVAQ
jgi:hypothetical protein